MRVLRHVLLVLGALLLLCVGGPAVAQSAAAPAPPTTPTPAPGVHAAAAQSPAPPAAAAPAPAAHAAATPEPAEPDPKAPDPKAPDPKAPDPKAEVPKPATPQPSAHKPTAHKPSAHKQKGPKQKGPKHKAHKQKGAKEKAPRPGVTAPPCPTTDRVAGTSKPPPAPQAYYKGDWRLGPAQLPTKGAIGRMLAGYERLDALSAAAFAGCYWNGATSGWWFPSSNGWALINGVPLKVTVTLKPGQKVDLFGSGFGHFLAPAGTPYVYRALPPSNLNTVDAAYPNGYHLYEVVKPFTVEAGPIRPWFGQRGGGLQYLTTPSIPDLVAAGNLRALN